MARLLQFALWNANSLAQHTEELKTFISIDIMLISKMHFTEKANFPPMQSTIRAIQPELLKVELL
jgi:hypothetical protein